MTKPRGGGDFPPGSNPTSKPVAGDAGDQQEILKAKIREEGDYKGLVKTFESLRTPAGRKESGFESQIDFVATLKGAIEKWGSGPKKDAAELFIADHESQAQGVRGGGDKKRAGAGRKGSEVRALAREAREEGDEGKGRGKKKEKPRAGGRTLDDQLGGMTIPEPEKPASTRIPVVEVPPPVEAVVVPQEFGPSAEAPTVEVVEKVVEDLVEQSQEAGQPITLENYRQLIMEWFPRLAVRRGHQDKDSKQWMSNLDGNACLFMFRQIFGFASGTEAEKKYVGEEVEYVKPGTYKKGALNLDTSPGLHGIQFEDETLFVDHHGSESERHSSAFQILFEDLKRVGLDAELTPENRTALERLSQFVTHIDSYSIPPKMHWGAAWNDSHRTVFGLCLAYQNNVPIEDLFEFFKHHDLREAWTLGIDESTEPYLAKFREMSKQWWVEKEGTERFVKEVKVRPNAMGFVAETKELGRILVQTQRSDKEKKAALQFAALAEGMEGVLVWEPNSGAFFLASGSQREVTPELMDKIGEGVLVRKSLIKKMGRERSNTLGSLLLALGVDKEKLPKEARAQVEEAEKVPAAVAAEKAKVEVREAEEITDFKSFITETLQRENGHLPPILFQSAEWLRRMASNWYYFLAGVRDYEKTSGQKSDAQEEAEEMMKAILETHPNLATERVFQTWLSIVSKSEEVPVIPEAEPVVDRETKTPVGSEVLPKEGERKAERKFGIGDWVVNKGKQFQTPYKVLKYEEREGETWCVLEWIADGKTYEAPESKLEKHIPRMLETSGGLFKVGDVVVPKGHQDGYQDTVEGFVVIDGVRWYQLKNYKTRLIEEGEMEKFVLPEVPVVEPTVPEEREEPVEKRTPEPLHPEEPLPSERREEEGEGPTSVETTDGEETPEPVREVYDTSNLRELGEGGEDPETVRVRMDEKRQAYIDLYKEYLNAKEGTGRWDKIKNKIPFLKKKEGAATLPPEAILEIKNRLESAREEYLQAKKEYARALFQEKARELADRGLTVEEITEELNRFGHEIFNKLIVGEEASLQAAQAAEWPAKEKGILRKGFEWWAKQHWTVRTLMTTGIITGALFAGGYIGVGAVGGYALSRLARSGVSAMFGQGVGKALDWMMGREIKSHVDRRINDLMIDFREGGGDPRALIDWIWEKQNKVFEKKKKDEKLKLYLKTAAMIAAGLGAAAGMNMLFAGSAEAAEQAAAAAKEAAKQGVVDAAGGVGSEGGVLGTAESGTGLSEPTLEDLQNKLQHIMEEADRQQKSFLEALHVKAEAAATQARLDELATIHKGEGVIHVFRRQLEAMPAKFGFTGDLKDAAAIHEWADKQATQLSIKAGYWDPSTGEQNWVRWDSQHPMRFGIEGDSEHGFKVTESGTEGKHFIHQPSEGEQMRINESRAKLPWKEFDQKWDQEQAARAAAKGARGLVEGGERPPASVLSIKGGAGAGDILKDSGFPKDVAPYGNYLLDQLKAAQDLVDQYGADPKLGPAARAALERVTEDVQAFQHNLNTHNLDAYKDFTPPESPDDAVRQIIEQKAGVKLPVPEPGAAKFSLAELLRGGRIAIERNWGLRFEAGGGGRPVPVIDAPRGDMSKVFESHADMKTDGWLQPDKVDALAARNNVLGAVPQEGLRKIDYLIRALDHLKSAGAGASEAANIVRGAIRTSMDGVAETIQKPVEEVFTKTFLDRVK